MGLQRRSAVIAFFVVVSTLVIVALPIKWHNVQWGTVPEWIGLVVLLLIAAGVWALVRSSERSRYRSDHFE